MKKDVVEGTIRLRNHIGESYTTQLELVAGSTGTEPMFSLSSDLYFSLYKIGDLFKSSKSQKLEEKNSRLKNINMLFGLSYGTHGLTFNFGIDLAGLTIKLPLIFANNQPEGEDEESLATKGILGGIVLLLYFGSTFIFNKMITKPAEKKKVVNNA